MRICSCRRVANQKMASLYDAFFYYFRALSIFECISFLRNYCIGLYSNKCAFLLSYFRSSLDSLKLNVKAASLCSINILKFEGLRKWDVVKPKNEQTRLLFTSQGIHEI